MYKRKSSILKATEKCSFEMSPFQHIEIFSQAKKTYKHQNCTADVFFYYIGVTVLLENIQTVKFIRNYIRDLRGVFPISFSLVRRSMT